MSVRIVQQRLGLVQDGFRNGLGPFFWPGCGSGRRAHAGGLSLRFGQVRAEEPRPQACAGRRGLFVTGTFRGGLVDFACAMACTFARGPVAVRGAAACGSKAAMRTYSGEHS